MATTTQRPTDTGRGNNGGRGIGLLLVVLIIGAAIGAFVFLGGAPSDNATATATAQPQPCCGIPPTPTPPSSTAMGCKGDDTPMYRGDAHDGIPITLRGNEGLPNGNKVWRGPSFFSDPDEVRARGLGEPHKVTRIPPELCFEQQFGNSPTHYELVPRESATSTAKPTPQQIQDWMNHVQFE